MFIREQCTILQKRISEPNKFIQVIMGPRQVGKTTLITQFLSNLEIAHLFVSADDAMPQDVQWISQQWEAARIKQTFSKNKDFLLIIDEIQNIHNWSHEIKKNWDNDAKLGQPIKLILLGSSRLLLQQGLSESLAGRFETIPMFHWTYQEMNKAFGFSPEQYVWFGGYPGAATLIKDASRWKNYIKNSLIDATISRDILMLTRIDKPALIKHLFELGCRFSGQMLSYNKMLGQLQDAGNTTTLSHYLNLLDSSGLLSGLEKFSNQEVRVRSSSPKFQVMNNALLTVYSGNSFKEAIKQPALWGRHVESAIGAHLVNHSKISDIKLYFWRNGNNEVDFVIVKNKKVIAIEVKSGATIKTSGIKEFIQSFKNSKSILISPSGLTWQEFLLINPNDLF